VTCGAAAVGFSVVRAWRRPIVGAVASACLAVVAYAFVQAHSGRDLGRSRYVEDAGTLVRRIERERRPGDMVLVHRNAGFIFGYYQTATPTLDAWRAVAVGYVPRAPDAGVAFVGDQDLETKARVAAEAGTRVWFVGSRLRRAREQRIRAALARVGRTVLDERRRNAFLVLVQRTDRVQ